MKKSRILSVILLLTIAFSCAFGGCGKKGGGGDSGSQSYSGTYDIRLTAIGSTTIKAGKTLQIRASVTGTTNKDVTFTSENESIATISDTGLVTGVSEGTVNIWCSLDIEPNCKKSLKIKVEPAVVPQSITITGTDSEIQWVGESLQLNTEVTPAEASSMVTWESSDETVATVSESGLVAFLKQGNVTITCASVEDSSVTNNISFTVKQGVFRSDLGSPYWNIVDQCADENPHVSLELDSSKLGYHSCYFANVLSTRYYAEATFKLNPQISTWVWQGIGLGSGLSETSTRYFIFSPRVDGQGNDFNKFIVKDLPNETWPAITERSQTWGENGLNSIDWQNSPVKIGMVRDNNTYYYLINDKLMYVDETTIYDEVPTMPILISIDLSTTVTDYSVTVDDAAIDAKLAQDQFKKSFYAANPDIVVYTSDELFGFRSNNVLSKDNKVKSIGDKAKLVGDFTVEFDITNMGCNSAHTSSMTGLTLNLSRYDKADTVETFMVGKSTQQNIEGFAARWLSWNYQKSMESPEAPYFWSESSTPAFTDATQTHHIKVTRTIENNESTFKMWVDGNEIVFDVLSSKWNTMTSPYTGAYIIWVGGEYASGEISNFVYTSNVNK